MVGDGAVIAIAGRVARTPRPTPATLLRYDRMLRGLSLDVPSLLPARFGTCFANEEELRLVLRAREASLLRTLAHVRRRVQMTIRMADVPAPAPVSAPRVGRGVAPAGVVTGAAYLRARAAAAALARRVPGFDPVRTALARWVRDERVDRRGPQGSIAVHHLVPRASVGVYRKAAARAAESEGIRLTLSGPWPPYAFAVDEPL